MKRLLQKKTTQSQYDMPYSLYKYKNGMQVLYIQIKPSSKLVYIKFYTRVGEMMESQKKDMEIAHFLEHLVCAFTSSKYPSAKDNIDALDKRGAQVNASTTQYYTDYYILGNKKVIPFFMDLIGNAFIDFKIDPEIFKQEKQSVMEELRNLQSDIWNPFEEELNKLLYPNHPISWTFAQRIKNTAKLTPKAVENYYHENYGTNNTLLVIASSLHIDEMEKYALPFLKRKKYIKTPQPTPYPIVFNNLSEPKYFFYLTPAATAYNIIFIYSSNIGAFNKYADILPLLCMILTGDFSSLLVKRLRTEEGLVYGVNCDIEDDEYFQTASKFKISTTCKKKNVKKVIKIILECMETICDNTFNQNAMTRLHNNINTQFLHANTDHSLDRFASHYGYYALYNQQIQPQQFLKIYQRKMKFTPQQLCSVAQKIFNPKNLIIAVSGNKQINL